MYINYSIFCEDCSKDNASYFILSVHDIRSGCWCYHIRGWTFPPVFPYMLLPCGRWQQRGSLAEWHLTQKCFWSKGMELNSSMQKNSGTHSHSPTLAEALWRPSRGCELKSWRRKVTQPRLGNTCNNAKGFSRKSYSLWQVVISIWNLQHLLWTFLVSGEPMEQHENVKFIPHPPTIDSKYSQMFICN